MNAGTCASGTRANGTTAAKAIAERTTAASAIRCSCELAGAVDKSVLSGSSTTMSVSSRLCVRGSRDSETDGPTERSTSDVNRLIAVPSNMRKDICDRLDEFRLPEWLCEDRVGAKRRRGAQIERAA